MNCKHLEIDENWLCEICGYDTFPNEQKYQEGLYKARRGFERKDECAICTYKNGYCIECNKRIQGVKL